MWSLLGAWQVEDGADIDQMKSNFNRPLSELVFKGCEKRFACAPMLTYFRVRSASVLGKPPFSLLENEF
jgi:hypothetical protein